MPRLLILACGATKRLDPEPVPAVERYTGPNYTTLQKFLREHPEQRDQLSVLIISAKFGLIRGSTLIPHYDQRMDARRARELHVQLVCDFNAFLAAHQHQPFTSTFINLGADYREALAPGYQSAQHIGLLWPNHSALGTVSEAHGRGIGVMRGQMRQWLYAGI